MNVRSTIAGFAAAWGLVLAATGSATAGSTDPMLVIGHATTSGSPARIVDLLGAWGFDDILQIEYPLSVVVSHGTSFVRFPVGDVPVSGTFSGLDNGLTAPEIAALEATGSPEPGASIARLALHEMTLTLPASFPAGTVNVVLYVTLPGEGTFLSNTAQAVGEGS